MKYLVPILSLLFFSQTVFSKTDFTNNNPFTKFEVFTNTTKATILYDKSGSPLDSIASYLLAEDIFKVTNYKPKVLTDIKQAEGNVIVIDK